MGSYSIIIEYIELKGPSKFNSGSWWWLIKFYPTKFRAGVSFSVLQFFFFLWGMVFCIFQPFSRFSQFIVKNYLLGCPPPSYLWLHSQVVPFLFIKWHKGEVPLTLMTLKLFTATQVVRLSANRLDSRFLCWFLHHCSFSVCFFVHCTLLKTVSFMANLEEAADCFAGLHILGKSHFHFFICTPKLILFVCVLPWLVLFLTILNFFSVFLQVMPWHTNHNISGASFLSFVQFGH